MLTKSQITPFLNDLNSHRAIMRGLKRIIQLNFIIAKSDDGLTLIFIEVI